VVMSLPSRKTSKVTRVIGADGDTEMVFPPQAVTVTLADEIDISRGEMLVHPDNLPRTERQFEAMMVWMNEQKMDPYANFFLKHTTQTTRARIDQIKYRIDVNTLEQHSSDAFELNEIGRVVLTTNKPLLFDPYHKNHETGSFVLIDPITNNTCAVGMIIDKLSSDDLFSRIADPETKRLVEGGHSLINKNELQKRYHQKGVTLWITGLHGSGKNLLAYTLERQLFEKGATVVLLDGSTTRSGLSKELDYSPTDRAEHMRRVAHVCRILNDQGIITICSFISPKAEIREQVSNIIGKERFKLFYMEASMDYCKKNKPGLYEKALQNQLKHIPGIDEIYDTPDNPDLVLDPEDQSNINNVLNFLEATGIFPVVMEE